MNSEFIEKLERSLYTWVFENRFKIITALVIAFLIYFGTLLPYFNLYLTNQSVPVLILLAIALTLNVRTSWLVILGLLLLLPAFVLDLLGRYRISETIGNFIYALLLFATVKGIFLSKRKQRK